MDIEIKTRSGEVSVSLEAPKSLSAQSAILRASVEDPYLAGIAALGQAWSGSSRPRSARKLMGHKVMLYAQAVEDELLRRGVSLPEMARVGNMAFELVVRGLVPDMDSPDPVGDVEDFSEAPAPETS